MHAARRALVTVALHASFFSATDEDEPCLIFQVLDVTARRIAEQRLHHIAHHDDLTNLPNRPISSSSWRPPSTPPEGTQSAASPYSFSTATGSRRSTTASATVRRRAARRAREAHRRAAPAGDVIARLGGDEFAILARNMGEEDR